MQPAATISICATKTRCVPCERFIKMSRLITSRGSGSGGCFPVWLAAWNLKCLVAQWSMGKAAPKVMENHFKLACMLAAAVGLPAETSRRNSARRSGDGCRGSADLAVQTSATGGLMPKRPAECLIGVKHQPSWCP